MADVKIDLTKVMNGLSSAKDNFEDMSKFFRNISELELSDTKLRFKSEKDPEGNKWPDPITIRRDGEGSSGGFTKEQSWNYVLKSNFHAVPNGWHWFDRNRDKVMRDSGTLYNSISAAYGKDYAIVGTNIEYAEKLQKGRFPFIGVTAKTEDNINEAMALFLKGLFK